MDERAGISTTGRRGRHWDSTDWKTQREWRRTQRRPSKPHCGSGWQSRSQSHHATTSWSGNTFPQRLIKKQIELQDMDWSPTSSMADLSVGLRMMLESMTELVTSKDMLSSSMLILAPTWIARIRNPFSFTFIVCLSIVLFFSLYCINTIIQWYTIWISLLLLGRTFKKPYKYRKNHQ